MHQMQRLLQLQRKRINQKLLSIKEEIEQHLINQSVHVDVESRE